jgi:O-succinylbenzoic acid--CoA ligase
MSVGAEVGTEQACVPEVYARGRWWSAHRAVGLAAAWLGVLADTLGDDASPCAAAVPFTPDGVALFAALSARRGALAVLPSDPALWPDRAPLYLGMPLVLANEAAAHAAEAERRGFRPIVLPEVTASGSARLTPLRCAGFVVQTSGSTGRPKAVFRPTAHVVAGALARARALGLGPGAGLIGSVPPFSGHGVVQIVTAMALGGPLGLLGPIDHREALRALAMPAFHCWRATPHFVDLLARCKLLAAPVVPPVCLASSAMSESVHRAFRRRFGVPIRGTYSSSETGVIAVDAAPDDDVRWDAVGRLLPDVDVRLGDEPSMPVPTGAVGRVWVRSPWLFGGYGVPPNLDRPGMVDGFWPTRDLARFDADGRLSLCGRMDDCIRTREGRLVDLAAIAARLRAVPDVLEVLVLPMSADVGSSYGAVVQSIDGVSADALRRDIAAALPPSFLPRHLTVVPELPRLPNGKPDRLACAALLTSEMEAV